MDFQPTQIQRECSLRRCACREGLGDVSKAGVAERGVGDVLPVVDVFLYVIHLEFT